MLPYANARARATQASLAIAGLILRISSPFLRSDLTSGSRP